MELDDGIKERCSLKKFLECVYLYDSRAYSLGKIDGMCPMMDMPNHSLNPNATYFQSVYNNGMSMKAVRNIKRGEEITISYGPKTNSHFV